MSHIQIYRVSEFTYVKFNNGVSPLRRSFVFVLLSYSTIYVDIGFICDRTELNDTGVWSIHTDWTDNKHTYE